jgi:hypothetical protein
MGRSPSSWGETLPGAGFSFEIFGRLEICFSHPISRTARFPAILDPLFFTTAANLSSKTTDYTIYFTLFGVRTKFSTNMLRH